MPPWPTYPCHSCAATPSPHSRDFLTDPGLVEAAPAGILPDGRQIWTVYAEGDTYTWHTAILRPNGRWSARCCRGHRKKGWVGGRPPAPAGPRRKRKRRR